MRTERYLDQFIKLMEQFAAEAISGRRFEQEFLKIRRQRLDEVVSPDTEEDRIELLQALKSEAITQKVYEQKLIKVFQKNSNDHSILPFSKAEMILAEVFYGVDEFVDDPDSLLPETVQYGGRIISEAELREITQDALDKLKQIVTESNE